jgi:hypothetical protein
MSSSENTENKLKTILKESYNTIQPEDSWEALRSRINNRINDKDSSDVLIKTLNIKTAFWRRTAMALAACFIVASGLLIWGICTQKGASSKITQGLLSQEQVEQLGTVFSHIRELFGNQRPWMVVETGGQGEIGVENPTSENINTGKVVIIRLSVNNQDKLQYYDVVALAGQQVSFSIPATDGSTMNVSLKPTLTNDNTIAVDIRARLDGQQAGDTVTIADNRFTSVLRMKSDSKSVSIDAVGRSAYKI